MVYYLVAPLVEHVQVADEPAADSPLHRRVERVGRVGGVIDLREWDLFVVAIGVVPPVHDGRAVLVVEAHRTDVLLDELHGKVVHFFIPRV